MKKEPTFIQFEVHQVGEVKYLIIPKGEFKVLAEDNWNTVLISESTPF